MRSVKCKYKVKNIILPLFEMKILLKKISNLENTNSTKLVLLFFQRLRQSRYLLILLFIFFSSKKFTVFVIGKQVPDFTFNLLKRQLILEFLVQIRAIV